MIPLNIIHEILKAGVWAPSGDNRQPWKFSIQGDRVDVHNAPERDVSLYNFEQKAVYVSHGALLENIRIASSALGFSTEISLFPTAENQNNTASILFIENKKRDEPLYQFISRRATNRKPYKTSLLSLDQQDDLIRSAKEIGYGTVALIEDADKKNILARAVSANEQIVLETEIMHKTFFEYVVWSKMEEQEKKSGLYIKTLELSPPQALGFRLFKYWPIMKMLNKIGFAKFVSNENAKIYASSAAIGAIFIPGTSAADFIMAGRLLERVWLKTTRMGLSFQPLTGISFLMHRIQANQAEALSQGHKRIISDAYSEIQHIFQPGNNTIALLFRIGNGGEPSARSSRLEPVIINA